MAEKPDGNASAINTTRSNIKSASASAVDPGGEEFRPAPPADESLTARDIMQGNAMKPEAPRPASAWEGGESSTGWTGPGSEQPAAMETDPIPGVPGTFEKNPSAAMEGDPIPGVDVKLGTNKPGLGGKE